VRSLRSPLRAPAEIAGLVRLAIGRLQHLRASPRPRPSPAPESTATPNPEVAPPSFATLEVADDRPGLLPELRIAAVLDQFSHESFSPDCRLLALRRDEWVSQMRDFRPHLLLVESAWRGLHGDWEGLVSPCSMALRELVGACRAAGIPTVFWNKEDPLHFEAFIESAALFDAVFTTDASTIPHYRRELGHDRVYCMPFALQPAMFNPLSEGEREHAFFFAGAYYGNLAGRARDSRRVFDALRVVGPLAIFDRNHGSSKQGNTYPESYRRHVRGGVPYEEIPALYRRFEFGVNINTVKQSPTMFARRVFELIGSGCGVYGNFSVGMRRMLGNLVVASDDQEALFDEAWRDFTTSASGVTSSRRTRALRKVLREHTSAARLAYVCEKMLPWHVGPRPVPRFVVLSKATNEGELASVLASFARQQGVDATLVIDAHSALASLLPAGVVALTDAQRDAAPVCSWGEHWVAPFHPADAYDSHYLLDIALAQGYAHATAIGKAAYVKAGDGSHETVHPEFEYRRVSSLALRRCAMAEGTWTRSVGEMLEGLDDGSIESAGACSIDAGSYVENGASWSSVPEPPMDEGVALRDLLEQAHELAPVPALDGAGVITGAELAAAFNLGEVAAGTSASPRRHRLELCSVRPAGHPVVLRTRPYSRIEFEHAGQMQLFLDAPPVAEVTWGFDALDGKGDVLARFDLPPQLTVSPAVPAATTAVRITATVDGPVVTYADGLHLHPCAPSPLLLCGKGRLLVVTNAYPSRRHAYRNGFVHRRVIHYRKLGIPVDVVVARKGIGTASYDFDGVTVTQCDPAVLSASLDATRYDAIAVHFLDRDIWDALASSMPSTRTVVWVHGADIQPWTRRAFNYRTQDEREIARQQSDARQVFWREVFEQAPHTVRFIFVSATFAAQCWEDLGLRLADDRWEVIHNPIDTALFEYVEKEPAQRLKVLSIRPHASRIYANDLVAKTIEHLSGHPAFTSMHFTLVGDGPLWDENFSGLACYPNVELQRGLVHQSEIPAMHREHGVFLVPTRGDTQGVSRDEAMASGLVPITCAVGAVPEFVDAQCGILCPGEDPEALALAISDLIGDPERFLRLSRGAAQRVRAQSEAGVVVRRELEALGLATATALPEQHPDRSLTSNQVNS